MQRKVAALACAAGIFIPTLAGAQAPAKDDWRFQANINIFLPTISGKTGFPAGSGGSSAAVDIDDIIENLQFTFMGGLEARKGPWAVLSDLIYIDVGAERSGAQSFRIGNIGIPAGASANVQLDLKGWAWTTAGTYRLSSTPAGTLDVLAGVRQLKIETELGWTTSGNVGSIPVLDRAGRRESDVNNWDFIVGAKGRLNLGTGGRWFAPYYVDIGTGNSDLTIQALAGVGYSFGWGDVALAWRYLDYQLESTDALQEANFNGPNIGFVFRW